MPTKMLVELRRERRGSCWGRGERERERERREKCDQTRWTMSANKVWRHLIVPGYSEIEKVENAM